MTRGTMAPPRALRSSVLAAVWLATLLGCAPPPSMNDDITKFVGALSTATISGTVTGPSGALSGATVSITGGATTSAQTDGSGKYSFTLATGKTYTVTATLTGCTFSAPQTFNTIGLNHTANFTGTGATCKSAGTGAGGSGGAGAAGATGTAGSAGGSGGASGAPGLTKVPAFSVTGSIAVNEPDSCDGGVSGDLSKNGVVSWTTCHALKEHHDASGNPITTNSFVATALTPVPSTIRAQVACTYADGSSDWPPKVFESQTNFNGAVTVPVPAFTCGLPSATGVGLIVSASLSHDIVDAQGDRVGTVRAIWDQAVGATVYNSILTATEPPLYMTTDADGQFPTTVATSTTHNWGIPRVVLSSSPVAFPLPAVVALGAQNFDAGAAPTYYEYMRGLLQAFHTEVSLHRKLQALLDPATYAQMFFVSQFDSPASDAAFSCDHCFTLLATSTGTDHGGYRVVSVQMPETFSGAPGALDYAGLISWGFPSHEFGHAIAAALAPNAPAGDNTMQVTEAPSGELTVDHAPYEFASTVQQQEMGQAIVEGIADAMGSFFLDKCAELGTLDSRMLGDLNPLDNMWDAQQFEYCDATGIGCPFGAFRFQMSQRGIAPNSAAWSTRLARLTALAQQASALGENMVLSNNEAKYRNFFCDLLVAPTVSFAKGLVGGKSYVADYTWTAAEILDGRTPPVTIKTYAADPTHQNATISLATLFSTLNTFVPGINNFPSSVPAPLWIPYRTITDGANQAYDDVRLVRERAAVAAGVRPRPGESRRDHEVSPQQHSGPQPHGSGQLDEPPLCSTSRSRGDTEHQVVTGAPGSRSPGLPWLAYRHPQRTHRA